MIDDVDSRPLTDRTGRSGSPTGPISPEPLINAIHRWGLELLFALYAVGMVYMSFVPFDVNPMRPGHGGPPTWYGLPTPGFNMPDILANIGAYFPMGGFAFLVVRRRKLGRIACAALVLAGVAVLSYTIEYGQRFVMSRVSSWVDVTSNLLGAALGVAFAGLWEDAIARILRRARHSVRREPWGALTKVFVCAVLLIQLRPYDVVVDPVHTTYALRHADIRPTARWVGLPDEVAVAVGRGRRDGMHELRRVQWEYGLDRFVDITLYAAVSALTVLSLATAFGRHRARLFLWAGFVTVSLAVIVTLIRIYLISHGLDTAHLVCGVVGWPIGCLVARRFRAAAVVPSGSERTAESFRLGTDGRWMPGRWALLGAVGVIAVIAAYELVPFDFGITGASLGKRHGWMNWVPFSSHFQSRMNDAIYDISGKTLRYGLLAVCVALILRRVSRRSWRVRLVLAVSTICAAATLVQVLHLWSPSRHSDVTTIILAAMGGLGGAVGLRWLIDCHRVLTHRVADDLLTTRLIEGATFDKGSAVMPHSPHTGASPTDQVESGRQG